jgi:Sec-independent protein secretion pathway component TatC
MLSLVFPLIFLYEVSIWCVRLMEMSRARDERARGAGEAGS